TDHVIVVGLVARHGIGASLAKRGPPCTPRRYFRRIAAATVLRVSERRARTSIALRDASHVFERGARPVILCTAVESKVASSDAGRKARTRERQERKNARRHGERNRAPRGENDCGRRHRGESPLRRAAALPRLHRWNAARDARRAS